MAIDIDQHPREWRRRISNVELCLPTGSPAVKKLHKAYKDWQQIGPEKTEEYTKAVDALFDSWHEAFKEIDNNNERIKDHKKWWFSVSLSVAAIIISALSIAISAYFQYENLKINQRRLNLQVGAVSKPNEVSSRVAADKPKYLLKTHNNSIQPTAKASAD